jgi:Family of unknown function (DUF6311)
LETGTSITIKPGALLITKQPLAFSLMRELQRVSSLVCGTMAFVTGVTIVFCIFPTDMLLDRWEWWEKARGDYAQSVIGYVYLARDTWRWPVTITTLLNPPDGANVVYTDSIPAAALVGKIIYNMTGTLPLYLGRWVVFAYGMQAFLGWLIFRQVGLRPLAALVPSILVVMMPAFIFRLGHFTLVAHWVVLAAILFYIRAVAVAGRRELYAEAVAIGSVLSIHPYLLAMSAPVFLAGVAEAARRKRILWRTGIGITTLMVAVVGTWAFICGIVGHGGDLPVAGGFGRYSMNLASPFTPQISSIPGFNDILDQTGGQYEGFNYLGGGVLFLIIGMFLFRRRAVVKMISTHPVLVILLTGLTFFAASSKAYIGQWHIGDLGYETLPVLDTVTSVFRSSGRFFWPVGYFAVIAAVALLARTVSAHTAAVATAAVVFIQWADINSLVVSKKVGAESADLDLRKVWSGKAKNESPNLVDRVAFSRAANSHSEFALYPTYSCAEETDQDKILQLQLIAARANIPVNGAYLSHGQTDCGEVRDRFVKNIAADSVTQNPLVVIFDRTVAAQLSSRRAMAGFNCRDGSGMIVCSRNATDPAFTALGMPFRTETAMLPVEEELSIGKQQKAEPFLAVGWWDPEGQWRWGRGEETSIVARLSRPVCSTLVFKAMVLPLSSGPYVVDRAKATLNGAAAGEITLTERAPHVMQHEIPLGERCVQDVDIGLHFSDLRSPQELKINDDPRKLSWMFQWISIGGGE